MFLMGNGRPGLADVSLSSYSYGILKGIPGYFAFPFNSAFVTSSYLMSYPRDSCCGGLGEG